MIEDTDDWADLTSVTIERTLEVARAHGTTVAAVWSGWPADRVRVLRQRHDGYDRGRGHPSRSEMAAMPPRLDCPCTRCVVWRWDLVRDANHRAGSVVPRPSLVDPDTRWQDDAACVGKPLDWWFPQDDADRDMSSHVELFDGGRQVCRACPVEERCLAFAEVNRIEHGMWGGLTPWERAELVRFGAA